MKHYKSEELGWLILRPLNIFQRENLIEFYNGLSESCKFSNLGSVVLDEDSLDYHLISCIFLMYDLSIEELDIKEIDTILNECILPVNFPKIYDKKDKLADAHKAPLNQSKGSEDDYTLSTIISKIWGLCDSSAEALMIMKELPAEVLLDAVAKRSKDLSEMNKSSEDRKKEGMNRAKKDLVRRHKEKMELAKKQAMERQANETKKG